MREWMRAINKGFREYVINDWKYKLVALAAALVIWAYVAGQQSMQVIYTVPLRFQSVPTGLHIVAPKVNAAEVTLSGPRDRVLTLHKEQIAVSLDLSGLRNGRNQYQISSRDVIAPPGIDVRDVSPRQLSIQLAADVSVQ